MSVCFPPPCTEPYPPAFPTATYKAARRARIEARLGCTAWTRAEFLGYAAPVSGGPCATVPTRCEVK